MKILNKITGIILLLLILIMQLVFIPLPKVYAASAPNLGTASGYSVFGQTGVTNTGGTHMWGDVGENGAGDGSTSGLMDGTLFTVAQPTIVSAITSAYGDLAGETQTGSISLSASPTVGPGVYDIAATAFNSTLTLDGAGVYIFRSTSSIAQAAGGTMNLTNGACASNVFWQIPAAMTFAATGNIEGTIIAGTLISFVSGTSLKGRAWAGTQVTLINNQVTEPATCSSPTPTATPTPTPTATTSSTSSSTSTSDGKSSTSTKVGPILNYITPIIIESKRIDSDSISISWGPYSGINTFIVQYGPENGKWPYSVNITGFSTILNALPSNQPIWVRVATRDDISIGQYGDAKLIGGPSLPNTGFAPRQNDIPWYISSIIFLGISISFALIQRKHKSSSKHESLH